MSSGRNGDGGVWFLAGYGGLDLEPEVRAADLIWSSPSMDDPSTVWRKNGLDFSQEQGNGGENASSKKRNRLSSFAGAGNKACREKMRRDRLNDRFAELSSILDPGKLPKSDKIAILTDATCRLNQLRLEMQKLKESNESLRNAIKNLKAEKSEMRDEKSRLKAKKDQIEQMLKGLSLHSPFIAHPAAAPFHPAAYATCNKNIPYDFPPMGMWQWISPAELDTSQDHVLRPPVA